MRPISVLLLVYLTTLVCLTSCVDPADLTLASSNDVLVVEGAVTNLAEPQIFRLNRSRADPLTGRFGTVPISQAILEVIEDSTLVVTGHETVTGSYQLPADFKGKIGHTYQLRFTLSTGEQYQSTGQKMPAAPPIERVYAQFNPISLNRNLWQGFTAAHDIYLDAQDPANESNYYRWDWKLWEAQGWCRSCVQGLYSVNNVLTRFSSNGFRYFITGDSLLENCFYPPADYPGVNSYFVYDYPCRTQCWALFYSYDLNVFSDAYTNGGSIRGQKVAQIPFYQHNPCLVEIRQAALSAPAYTYFKQLVDQTQKTGGVADSPPTALRGNIHPMKTNRQGIVDYFTASAISTTRFWLDRKDAMGIPLGAMDPGGGSGLLGAELFFALNKRQPNLEPAPPNGPVFQILGNAQRPPTAICESTESQTPVKPIGWRD